MKLILLYIGGLALTWTGLNSLMVGLAYWGSADGALAPVAGGLLMLLLAARLLVGLVRQYLPPEGSEGRGLEE